MHSFQKMATTKGLKTPGQEGALKVTGAASVHPTSADELLFISCALGRHHPALISRARAAQGRSDFPKAMRCVFSPRQTMPLSQASGDAAGGGDLGQKIKG